jgi:glyoxylase-like metal-dependent hydrolase (beta-lactamase superfamily II)
VPVRDDDFMLRKGLIGIAAIVAGALVFVSVGLIWAHRAIKRERAPLPAPILVTLAAATFADLPVRLSIINTASQPMPRADVLDPAKDPHPNEPYVMSHPSFVIEWADGRILLVDLGMTRQGAMDFGRPLEWLGGAAPMQPHGSVAEQLGDARQRVQGIVFTHLHSDHVGGITELCEGLDHPLRVFMTDAQAERPNYTTRGGLDLLRKSSCVHEERLVNKHLMPVPGFDGVFVIAAGGHTPGSQMVTTVVVRPDGGHGYVFTGDVVNNIDGISFDVPKPVLYSLLVVPEDTERLGQLRGYLKQLRTGHNISPLVSHDQRALEASGVPAWQPQ